MKVRAARVVRNMVILLAWAGGRRVNAAPLEVLHDKCRATDALASWPPHSESAKETRAGRAMGHLSIFARKPVVDIVAEGAPREPAKCLGPFSITAMGIGAIIGAGIFVPTGTAAALY